MITTINRAIAQKEREEGEKGFTLIELLVVILIIGVLAAIAIPAFLNQRQSAWESQVESDIRNAVIAAESFAVAHNGSYAPGGVAMTMGDLDGEGFNGTDAVTITITSATAAGFTLHGEHDSIPAADKVWDYDSTDGIITETP